MAPEAPSQAHPAAFLSMSCSSQTHDHKNPPVSSQATEKAPSLVKTTYHPLGSSVRLCARRAVRWGAAAV